MVILLADSILEWPSSGFVESSTDHFFVRVGFYNQ
jgi:hypothetical protein